MTSKTIFIFDRVSLCSLGWHEIHAIAQADPELRKLHLPVL